jgi:23S rRNA A1618 N6-methylase RlmF
MLLVTESVLPSPVSARDVSDYSPFYNTPFDQYKAIRNGFGVPFEHAEISAAMANVFITVDNDQETTSTQERNLIEQSLIYWCNISRTGFMAKNWGSARNAADQFRWVMETIDRKKEKRLFKARTAKCHAGGALSWINGLRPYRVAVY